MDNNLKTPKILITVGASIAIAFSIIFLIVEIVSLALVTSNSDVDKTAAIVAIVGTLIVVAIDIVIDSLLIVFMKKENKLKAGFIMAIVLGSLAVLGMLISFYQFGAAIILIGAPGILFMVGGILGLVRMNKNTSKPDKNLSTTESNIEEK